MLLWLRKNRQIQFLTPAPAAPQTEPKTVTAYFHCSLQHTEVSEMCLCEVIHNELSVSVILILFLSYR